MTLALKYALNRCCCSVEEPPLNSCPCQKSTLPLTKSLTATGIDMEPVRLKPADDYPDINDTYTMDEDNLSIRNFYCGNAGFGVQQSFEGTEFGTTYTLRGIVHIGFTRLTEVSFGVLPTGFGSMPLGTWTIDPGIKALISIEATVKPTFLSFADASWALFWKVLNDDPNGTVDCDLDLSGFTFEAQRHTQASTGFPGLGPVFDASGASFSYT